MIRSQSKFLGGITKWKVKYYLLQIFIFGHQKDFLWEPRGFTSSNEHDIAVIQRYNDIVSDEDVVYILGDVCMGDLESGINKLKQLKGHKHLIRGNHCTDNKVSRYIEENIFESIQYATMIKYKKYNFEFDDNIAKNFNVALDAHNCYPIEIDEILTKIQEKWNKIHNEYERQQSQLQKIKNIKVNEMLDL